MILFVAIVFVLVVVPLAALLGHSWDLLTDKSPQQEFEEYRKGLGRASRASADAHDHWSDR